MFTNWLTSPSTSSTTTPQSNLMGQLSTNLMATPPDIILEVGPTPSVRFVAHSSLLAMHSGYLRSAIRMDENNSNIHNNTGQMDLPPMYLTNVTPEQFGPLLTYMYTGYLDLTLENIFAVLLATHVLHMPRALEICRSFLSRSQSEGYLNGGFLNQVNNTNNSENTSTSSSSSKNSKIIRPIASKPLISNLGFIVPPMQHISLPSTGTPFRSLSTQALESISSITTSPKPISEEPNNSRNSSPNDATCSNKSPIQKDLISHNTKRSPKMKRSRSKSSSIDQINNTQKSVVTPLNTPSNSNNTNTQVHQDNENKIIIDVASCDGPVRFRRVLNDAYGRQPDSVHLPTAQHERSHESVSYSFHQQMAKNIYQQRQHEQQQNSEESENSEDIKNSSNQGSGSGETFNCVYCKHTFKSQYCYQKHAKRHLNPLSLEQGEGIILAPAVTTFGDLLKEDKLIQKSSRNNSGREQNSVIPREVKNNAGNSDSNNSSLNNSNNNNNNNKREVRPLDMNVQYYPCKTCGSKFPSYYFVHKHRKLCHANEEN